MRKMDASLLVDACRVGYVKCRETRLELENNADQKRRNREILEQARQFYDGLEDLRRRRRRSRRYYRGEQWSDRVVVNGKSMTEEDYIKSQGKPALKQNMIRPPVRNVIGQYRCNPFKTVVYARNRQNQKAAEMMTVAVEAAYYMNNGKERDARMLEEFLISGMAVYGMSYAYDDVRQRPIPKFRAVNPARFFINTNLEDVCGDDVDFVGELADLGIDDVIAAYALNGLDGEAIRRLYGEAGRCFVDAGTPGAGRLDGLDFYTSGDPGLCRVIKVCRLEAEWRLVVHDYADASYEVWDISREEEVAAENAVRRRLGEENGVEVPMVECERRFVKFWKYYHLTPLGDTLFESECPYEHNCHPYVFKFYPMLDGEVWGMVEDLIDQQKMVNRMMILQDFIISASAKGVLLVPEECIPDDMTVEDFADEWVKYNGVIKFKAKQGMALPQQVSAGSINIGIQDMIQMQLRLMQDIAGVQGAIQGRAPLSGTAASLYAQETQNATLNVMDYLETFSAFLQMRDRRLMQLVKQFYTEPQYITVVGRAYSEEAKNYDPELIRNIDFENVIAKGNDTPTYRMVIDDMLWRLMEGGYLNLEMFLEHSSYPFADKLLESVKSQREQLAQGQMPPGVPPELLAQFQREAGASSPAGLAAAEQLVDGTK